MSSETSCSSISATQELPTSSSDKFKAKEVHKSFDAADLARLLLCIGFNLVDTAKLDNLEELHKLLKNKEENLVKVEITCIKSGTKIWLSKDDCCCRCPPEQSDDGLMWNVSGVSAQGNISITKSNIIPTVAPTKANMINTLLLKCIEYIVFSNTNDRNIDLIQEMKAMFGLRKTKSTDNIRIDHNLSRITIGSTPPRHSSSPICLSLNHPRTSLGGSDSLVDVLKEIEGKLKFAIDVASKKNITFTKTSDSMKISPLASLPSTSSAFEPTGNQAMVQCVEIKSTPISKTPKKQAASTGAKKKGLIPPSRLNLLKYKKDIATSSLGRTPASSMVKDRTGKSYNLSVAKVKSAISVDANLQSKLKPGTSAPVACNSRIKMNLKK
nr:uncharacterized protein LOC111427798 [Onthophagus taurus]